MDGKLELNRNYTSKTMSYPSNNNEEIPSFNLNEIDKDLFDTTADKCAKVISKANNSNGGKKQNQPTQLRRFYDEVVLYYDRIGNSENTFNNTLPFIYMIKSKVAYAEGRGNVDVVFKTFMNNLINQIKDIQTLKNAKLFMEAVMGFYKGYAKD